MTKTKQKKSYKDLTKFPKKVKNNLPTSYDVIGDIILLKLQTNLLKYKKEIANALLQAHKNIKTICLIKPVSGELRIRNIEIIGGEKRTITIHKEYGLNYYLDISKVYFSPRLASERKRIADLVKKDEIIVDMFAGVAPFSIMIVKFAHPKIVYALDKNKKAIEFAKINLVKNNVLDKVEVIHGDAKKVNDIVKVKVDRIIMNLPFSAHLFFKSALKIIKNICKIHYYDILPNEKIKDRLDHLTRIANVNGITLSKIETRKIKSYTPREFYIGIDITAKKR